MVASDGTCHGLVIQRVGLGWPEKRTAGSKVTCDMATLPSLFLTMIADALSTSLSAQTPALAAIDKSLHMRQVKGEAATGAEDWTGCWENFARLALNGLRPW
jgi:hypothetical protein